MIRCTFTGLDRHTKLEELPLGYEYGILMTQKPEGRNRYPSMAEIGNIAGKMKYRLGHDKLALHVCGSGARKFMLEESSSVFTTVFPRIQINGGVTMTRLKEFCEKFSNCTVITQHTDQNKNIVRSGIPNHVILVDGSGGNGVSPERWGRPTSTQEVGFAGGLGVDNIVSEVERIKAVATGDWWIDMEGKLRDENDWFDVERVKNIVSQLEAI